MKTRCCGNCDFWEPTTVEVVGAQPHNRRAAEERAAQAALCTWDGDEKTIEALLRAPTWAAKALDHGNLTHEDDGENCPAWRFVR